MPYEKLLNTITIPGNLPDNQKQMRYSLLRRSLLSILPKSLFKYRDCKNQNHIDAFKNDLIIASKAIIMNDDFDTRVSYDARRIKEFIRSGFDSEGVLTSWDRIKHLNDVPRDVDGLIPNADKAMSFLQTRSLEEQKIISSDINEYLGIRWAYLDKAITELIQSMDYYVCLSETVYSAMMWGHYANNATGFALGYEFSKEEPLTSKLYKVTYGDQQLDATEFIKYLFCTNVLASLLRKRGLENKIQELPNHFANPDLLMVKKIALHKSLEWAAEKEWRLIIDSVSEEQKEKDYIPLNRKADVLYLGRRISDFDRETLLEIAKEKAIPVFQIGIDRTANTYSLMDYQIL